MPPSHKPQSKPRGVLLTEEPDKEAQTVSEKRLEGVNGYLQIAQLGCVTFGQFADAGAIGLFGPPLASEVVKLAENNSKIASKIDLFIQMGPYAGVVSAALPLIAQIMVNHKVFKPEQFANAGVVSPEVLETQMKTAVMRSSLEALAAQKQAEQELRQMEEDLQSKASMNGQDNNSQDMADSAKYGE